MKAPRIGTRARAVYDLMLQDSVVPKTTRFRDAKRVYDNAPPAYNLSKFGPRYYSGLNVSKLLSKYGRRIGHGLYEFGEKTDPTPPEVPLFCQDPCQEIDLAPYYTGPVNPNSNFPPFGSDERKPDFNVGDYVILTNTYTHRNAKRFAQWFGTPMKVRDITPSSSNGYIQWYITTEELGPGWNPNRFVKVGRSGRAIVEHMDEKDPTNSLAETMQDLQEETQETLARHDKLRDSLDLIQGKMENLLKYKNVMHRKAEELSYSTISDLTGHISDLCLDFGELECLIQEIRNIK